MVLVIFLFRGNQTSWNFFGEPLMTVCGESLEKRPRIDWVQIHEKTNDGSVQLTQHAPHIAGNHPQPKKHPRKVNRRSKLGQATRKKVPTNGRTPAEKGIKSLLAAERQDKARCNNPVASSIWPSRCFPKDHRADCFSSHLDPLLASQLLS